MGATASTGGGDDGADPPPPRPSESARRAYRGKTILITGASRGLGRSLAIALASSCDPSLLILSGRDEGALAGVRGECERAMIAAAGGGRRRANAFADEDDDDDDQDEDDDGGGGARRVEIVACDLADGASVERLAAESLRLAASRRRAGRSPGGRDGAVVDVLINNGGVSSRSSFLETRIDVDEMVMRVNFHSGAALAKGLVPAMIGSGNGGRVIWISSVQGKRELLFAGVLSLSFFDGRPRPPGPRRFRPVVCILPPLSSLIVIRHCPRRGALLSVRLCCSRDAVPYELRGFEVRRAGVLRIAPVGTGVGRRVRACRQPGLRTHRSEPVGGHGGREVLQQDGRDHGERYVLRA